jgi:ribonucleoside-diphosphate reductase alpha chain
LSPNARLVLEHRYLLRDEEGRAVESADGMFRRVAAEVAAGTRSLEGEAAGNAAEEDYYGVLSGLLFLPNSPTLMNAGTSLGQLAACFVLPVGDSLPEIFGALRDAAVIHQSGGGTGFSFSRLRPRGDAVRETGGVASGPVSFMRVFDMATEVVKQGGRRRGANMGVLSVSHPDVLEFVRAKEDPALLRNFNLSLWLPDAFLEAVERDGKWPLVNPRTGATAARTRARHIWSAVAEAAWKSGDPGVLFSDAIERANPLPALGPLEATNPCGEQPLRAYEACTLGSLNLARCVGPDGFSWSDLERVVRLAVRFLDDVLVVNRYPTPEIERATLETRKIGLGVMGYAECLIRLGLPYDSEEALAWGERIMESVTRWGRQESLRLGERRGPFPRIAESLWPGRGLGSLRNATVTTVAPTGTLSILAGTTSGIEPLFALAYERLALDGKVFAEVSPLFVAELERRRLPVDEILEEVRSTGSCRGLRAVPGEVQRLFAVAHDVSGEWHLRAQRAFQRHTDNAVSKTVNLPAAASPGQVQDLLALAWRLGLKGVTVFRHGCRGEQVLQLGHVPSFGRAGETARAHAEYAGECRVCST